MHLNVGSMIHNFTGNGIESEPCEDIWGLELFLNKGT